MYFSNFDDSDVHCLVKTYALAPAKIETVVKISYSK